MYTFIYFPALTFDRPLLDKYLDTQYKALPQDALPSAVEVK